MPLVGSDGHEDSTGLEHTRRCGGERDRIGDVLHHEDRVGDVETIRVLEGELFQRQLMALVRIGVARHSCARVDRHEATSATPDVRELTRGVAAAPDVEDLTAAWD